MFITLDFFRLVPQTNPCESFLVGNSCYTSQFNITCLWLLDWDGHNTLRLSSLSLSLLMGFDPVLFLYVIKLRFLDSYRYIRKLPAPIEYILSLHLIIEFIIQAMINIWIRMINIYHLG
jgi:hypothetical protein